MTDLEQGTRRPLSMPELRAVTYIEQFWNQNGKFPAYGHIRSKLKGVDPQELMGDPTFLAALSNRGIRVPVGGMIPDELTAEQIAAVGMVLDWHDSRSHNAKLRSLGISNIKWQGWLKNPIFKEYLHSLSTRNLDDALNVAHEGLIKATKKGDVNAIKYYMELTGRFSGDSGQTQNFRVMVQRMVETIQRHVKDPDTIRLIAADFEIIMSGGAPVTNPMLDRSAI